MCCYDVADLVYAIKVFRGAVWVLNCIFVPLRYTLVTEYLFKYLNNFVKL